MGNFNFRDLANSMVGNGQFHLPPNDNFRQGTVIGYDPNWNGTSHDYPTVSITLAGDDNPLHGFRFAETYTPNLGDTVWVMMSGTDGFVVSKLTDVPNGNDGHRSPTTAGVIGHGSFTDKTIISSTIATPMTGTAITTQMFPNRIYKAEATFAFTITNAYPTDLFSGTFSNHSSTVTVIDGTSGLYAGMSIAADGIQNGTTITDVNSGAGTITISIQTTKAKTATPLTVTSQHFVEVGFITPAGFLPMTAREVSNGAYTSSGMVTWFNTNTSGTYPYNWTGTYPNATFTWQLACRVYATGGTMPTATGVSQQIVIHDLGVAS